MYGAVIGDIVGSVYEFANIKSKNFEMFQQKSRFTDDTVMTVATIDSLLRGKHYTLVYKEWYRKYPKAGYGESFRKWAESDAFEPYNSWGNGAAMRVSPIGWFFEDLPDVLNEAKRSAEATHNHPEGIKGAQATAAAIFLARTGKSKTRIKKFIEQNFGYSLNESLDDIRCWYKFDVSCQGSVPQAITAFLEAENFEDAVRNAVSIGGDSDTISCIAGAIAEAYYLDIPEIFKDEAVKRLSPEMVILLDDFYKEIRKKQKMIERGGYVD